MPQVRTMHTWLCSDLCMHQSCRVASYLMVEEIAPLCGTTPRQALLCKHDHSLYHCWYFVTPDRSGFNRPDLTGQSLISQSHNLMTSMGECRTLWRVSSKLSCFSISLRTNCGKLAFSFRFGSGSSKTNSEKGVWLMTIHF